MTASDSLRAMPRLAALVLAVALPFSMTGCQEGTGEANGAVNLRVVGGQPEDQLTTTWEPEPDYYGTVRNTEDGKSFGRVPVGTYDLTVVRSGLRKTMEVEVSKGRTTAVTVDLG